MDSRDKPHELTRRGYIAGGSSLLGSALLTGCTGGSDGTANTERNTTTDQTSMPTETTSTSDGSYTAILSPVGEVEFDSVPENVFTMYNQYADMLVALGHGDAINSMFVPIWLDQR